MYRTTRRKKARFHCTASFTLGNWVSSFFAASRSAG
jgi:hypothetical protein